MQCQIFSPGIPSSCISPSMIVETAKRSAPVGKTPGLGKYRRPRCPCTFVIRFHFYQIIMISFSGPSVLLEKLCRSRHQLRSEQDSVSILRLWKDWLNAVLYLIFCPDASTTTRTSTLPKVTSTQDPLGRESSGRIARQFQSPACGHREEHVLMFT